VSNYNSLLNIKNINIMSNSGGIPLDKCPFNVNYEDLTDEEIYCSNNSP
jgi:hypothetical protein